MHYGASAGEGAGSALGEEGSRRGLEENSSRVEMVLQEAFDRHNVSLGYSHDNEANWTFSTIGLEPEAGEAPYMYRENASY